MAVLRLAMEGADEQLLRDELWRLAQAMATLNRGEIARQRGPRRADFVPLCGMGWKPVFGLPGLGQSPVAGSSGLAAVGSQSWDNPPSRANPPPSPASAMRVARVEPGWRVLLENRERLTFWFAGSSYLPAKTEGGALRNAAAIAFDEICDLLPPQRTQRT
jgi:hypothetical protein